jgi:hypothetical protein
MLVDGRIGRCRLKRFQPKFLDALSELDGGFNARIIF